MTTGPAPCPYCYHAPHEGRCGAQADAGTGEGEGDDQCLCVKDPSRYADEVGGFVATVYPAPNYKSRRWAVTTLSPGGGSGSGLDYGNAEGARHVARQRRVLAILEPAHRVGKDRFGYPNLPNAWTITEQRKADAP